jgi:RHS repeat-associated protein
VTVQWAQFDGLGRRLWKVVTNSGPHDGTVVYYYDGQRIIQTTDGSENMVQQFIHGTQYIDELVMMRRAGHGDLYIHQDANWNVIGATDLNGRLVERYEYTPYGELTAHQEGGYGDYDGDGDVDATDEDAIQSGGACLGGSPPDACRVLDLDFDGDYDSVDETLFASLDEGYMAHPGRRFSSVDQPFAHQGLLFDAEVGTYQNRARQYDPETRRFMQRDLVALPGDPGGQYRDGSSLYLYERAVPTGAVDPSGLLFFGCNPWPAWPAWGPLNPPWAHGNPSSGFTCEYCQEKTRTRTCYICWIPYSRTQTLCRCQHVHVVALPCPPAPPANVSPFNPPFSGGCP